jgi:phytoene synthase
VPIDVRAKALADFGDRFFADAAAGRSDDPVLKAVVHTVRAFDMDLGCFRRFLCSMAMDLSVATYETWDDLLAYMDGSAAVIGEMMLPILEPLDPLATTHARDLGNAFQLTNFLRDVGEDLDRGRVYLPQEDLRRFGADPSRRTADPAWRRLMRFEIDRCRELYRSADVGIAMLPPSSARCVQAARTLYSEILDRIEAMGLDVFAGRARVPVVHKLAVAGRTALARG